MALSYCWDDKIYRNGALVNGKQREITESLAAALLRLAKYLPQIRIWADALCIDQSNDGEKITQIPLMKAIYT